MKHIFITAERIHDGHQWLSPGTTVELMEDGTVAAIHHDPAIREQAAFHEGILLPGFVNTHCHLELSHMKGMIPKHTGLIPFLQEVTRRRNEYTEEEKRNARQKAYLELQDAGVAATGDIANSTDTLDLREGRGMHFHTFVECIGFTDQAAAQRLEYSLKIRDRFAAQSSPDRVLRQSIVPHAPYSVSPALFRMIGKAEENALVSIHNQESEEENRFYQHKKGAVNDLLSSLGIDAGFFIPSGKTSLQTYLLQFPPGRPFIFVHNTFSNAEDIRFAKNYLPESYWCLCPNANLYIENRLPDIPMLLREEALICIGTDSLASNGQLSVLAELLTLKARFPGLSWETLFRWATGNGARALQMEDRIGRILPGMKPGIIRIDGDHRVEWIVRPG